MEVRAAVVVRAALEVMVVTEEALGESAVMAVKEAKEAKEAVRETVAAWADVEAMVVLVEVAARNSASMRLGTVRPRMCPNSPCLGCSSMAHRQPHCPMLHSRSGATRPRHC